MGTDLPDPKAVFFNLEKNVAIKLFWVAKEVVDKCIEDEKDEPLLPIVPGTMVTHQLITSTLNKFIYRDVSCFCSMDRYMACDCYNTKEFEFHANPMKERKKKKKEETNQRKFIKSKHGIIKTKKINQTEKVLVIFLFYDFRL